MFSFRSQRSRQILATLSAAAVALTTAVGSAGAATPFNVTVTGSTTVFPFADGLRPGFQTTYSDSTIVASDGSTVSAVGSVGSTTGIKSLLQGTADVATASRPIQSSDVVAGQQFTPAQIDQWVVGLDGIAIVANASVPSQITSLTVSQILGIYNCSITNWSQINSAASGTIAPFTRTSASGTFGDFNKFIGGSTFTGPGACATVPPSGTCGTSGDSNPCMLAAAQNTTNGLAYVGSGFAYVNGAPATGIRIISVDGVQPTSATVDAAIKLLTGSGTSFSQSPAPDTAPSCTPTSGGCASTTSAYVFGRQLFMDTVKYLQLPATGTRTDNIARGIEFVNSAVVGSGQQSLLNEGFFGLLTHNPTSDPSFNGACVTQSNGNYCPQIIPPWDVQIEGITNIDAVVNVGNFWQQQPPAGKVKGWIRADCVQLGIVGIDCVVKIGNHWQETWNRWTD